MKLRHDMLTHGVYIVCAAHEGKRGGLAVAWATQVAKDQILICVGKQSATRELILASRAFGLSVLTRQQLSVARAFGTRARRTIGNGDRGIKHGAAGNHIEDDPGADIGAAGSGLSGFALPDLRVRGGATRARLNADRSSKAGNGTDDDFDGGIVDNLDDDD